MWVTFCKGAARDDAAARVSIQEPPKKSDRWETVHLGAAGGGTTSAYGAHLRVDGDGDVDILVANGGGHNNAIYINDGGRGEFRKLTEGIFVTDGRY